MRRAEEERRNVDGVIERVVASGRGDDARGSTDV